MNDPNLDYHELFERHWAGLNQLAQGLTQARAGGTLPGKLAVHNTTCLGLVYRGGVLVAADGQATASNLRIVTSDFEKIIPLDRHSLLAIAGVPGLAVKMARLLRAQFSFDEDRYEGLYLPPKSRVKTVAEMIQRNLPLAFAHQMLVVPLLAVFDNDPREPAGRIFSIWPDGVDKPETDFEAVGSGENDAVKTIKLGLANWRLTARQLELDQAKSLAIRALLEAHLEDAGTGENFFMKVVTIQGIGNISKEEIAAIKKKIREEG